MAQFRTKARAVELLGKGQIADLPTAISELWKNGYDAYADSLSCDLYMNGYKDIHSPVFVLSDTGTGMSKKDILEKWIVLGTDSKARGMNFLTTEERFGLEQRIPMGEKGIGRLSVSYLGSPMLMLTKKRGMACQALFFDWRILENYNLFVDDVDIPMTEFGQEGISDGEFSRMKEELLSNLDNTEAWQEQAELAKNIMEDVMRLNIPQAIRDEIVSRYQDADAHGTTFIVFKPHEQLLELAQYNTTEESDSIWEIRRSLGALFNIFAYTPDFTTSFNVRDVNGVYNIINDFFDKKDFEEADHYIKGSFDENGFFEGTVRVYRKTYEYSFRPVRLPGKTPYGPFNMELGVIEGQQGNSMLSPDAYAVMDGKTSRFGGLYIYRDKFRVLPYGRVDFDFLKFEERRARRMGEYFFRYNKMFGYLGITRDANRNLTDKAGREGLIENKAYREFKRDLIELFIDLAKTYFATPDKDSDNARSEQQEEIRKRNEKMADAEKRNVQQARKAFMDELKNNGPEIQKLQTEVEDLQRRMAQAAVEIELSYDRYKQLGEELDIKRSQLRRLQVRKSQRINLTERQAGIYNEYLNTYNQTSAMVSECTLQMDDVRKRFDVSDLRNEFQNRQLIAVANIGKAISSFRKGVANFSNRVSELFDEEQRSFIEKYKGLVSEGISSPVTAEDYRQAIAQVIQTEESIKDEIDERLRPFVNHLETLSLDVNDDVLMAWYKEQKAMVDEKLEQTAMLAQLGISVEIIDHEFNVLYSQMSTSLNLLQQYAKQHDEVWDTYRQLRNAFEHMEQNYKMLRPLYRSRRRQRTVFTGAYIKDKIETFFDKKIKELDVEITSNEDFDNYEFFTFESEVLSVFINIVNNALYWLIPVQNRKIRFEFRPDNGLILIMNNGVPIPDQDLSRIFTIFFTRRKDGRGIGLYLALHSLAAVGYRIFASNAADHNKLGGACFVIAKNE